MWVQTLNAKDYNTFTTYLQQTKYVLSHCTIEMWTAVSYTWNQWKWQKRSSDEMSLMCMGVRRIFPRRRHPQHFANPCSGCWRCNTNVLSWNAWHTPQRKCPMLRQQSQECGGLAAIARYATILFTIRYPQIFKAQYPICRFSLHRSIAIWILTKPQIMTLFYLARLISVT